MKKSKTSVILAAVLGLIIVLHGIVTRNDDIGILEFDGVWKFFYNAIVVVLIVYLFYNYYKNGSAKLMTFLLVCVAVITAIVFYFARANKDLKVANNLIGIVKALGNKGSKTVLIVVPVLFVLASIGVFALLIMREHTRKILSAIIISYVASWLFLSIIKAFLDHRFFLLIVLIVIAIAIASIVFGKKDSGTSTYKSSGSSYSSYGGSYSSSSYSSNTSRRKASTSTSYSESSSSYDYEKEQRERDKAREEREKESIRKDIRKLEEKIAYCKKQINDKQKRLDAYNRNPNSLSTMDIRPKEMQNSINDLKRDITMYENNIENLKRKL